jgi:serine/threonine-protein kinase RsbW
MSQALLIIDVLNDLSELARVAMLVEHFGSEHQLSRRTIFEINLALDEVLTNVVSYAYADDGVHHITVNLSITPDRSAVLLRVEDDGRPFDPTAATAPDLNLPLEQRPVGGLGIHLVRQLVDDLAYCRERDRNVLSMRKSLRAPAAPR